MSKAERRKRARQRSRERERSAVRAPSEPTEQALAEATVFAAPAGEVEAPEPSGFITGPVVPKVPEPVRTVRPEDAARAPLPAGRFAGALDRLDAGEQDEEDEDTEDEDDDLEDGEGDEDGEELDEQDALFNLACSAVEEGDALTWSEVVTWLLASEVDDPRLAFIVSLVAPDDETSVEIPKLSGARVLEKLELIGLEDIVREARDTVAAAPKEAGESEEERAVVRTTARELAAQAKRELAAKGGKPIRASDVRAATAGRVTR